MHANKLPGDERSERKSSGKGGPDDAADDQHHPHKYGQHHPALVQPVVVPVVVLAEAIGAVVVAHLPAGGVGVGRVQDGARGGEEDGAALPPAGQVVGRAPAFDRTEARHFCFAL